MAHQLSLCRRCSNNLAEVPELQQMLEELITESKKAGLCINSKKTVLLSNQTEDPEITAEGNKIEKNQETTYPGQIISFQNSWEKEITKRKANALKSFWPLKDIYKSKMSLKLKIETFEKCTMPVLTYGAQTWTVTDNQLWKIGSTQMAMERAILRVKRQDRKRNGK